MKAEIIEKLKESALKAIEALEPQIEVAVEAAINAKSDMLVDAVLAKVTELIPSKLDDVAVEQIKPEIKAKVKEFLLAQAEKISDKV